MRRLLTFLLFSISLSVWSQNQMIEVNGTRYHVNSQGLEKRIAGVPVVVFESGLGMDLGNWGKLIGEVAEFAPVFSYDRAGVGKSDKMYIIPSPRSVADNLHEILGAMKISPPYILIGHSLGGVFIRAFAGYYPAEVAGMLFIDPADFTESREDWNDIFRVLKIPEERIEEMLNTRLYSPPAKVDSVRYGPWSEQQMLRELRKTDFSEMAVLPLPQVPITFLVGGKFDVPPERRNKEYDQQAFFHIKNDSNMRRWKMLIHSSGGEGSLLYLTNAGHYIHWDDPESVIYQIKRLISRQLE